MSGWTPWRRDPRRLPGTLCDETPEAARPPEVGRWQPRDDNPLPSAYTVPAADPEQLAVWEARWREAQAQDPLTLTERVLDRRKLEDRYLAAMQRLREITADRDRLDEANARLVQRIRGLELTVQHLGARDGDTTPLPRVRSAPAPGPLAVADNELYIRPMPPANR